MPNARIMASPEFAGDLPPRPVVGVATTNMKRGHVSQPEDRHETKLLPRDMPFISDGDVLEVRNEDRLPVTFRWNRRATVIQPGEVGFVPFEALANQLGDPRSVEGDRIAYSDADGNRGLIPERYEDLTRLFAMYGIEQERIDDLPDRAPRVAVKTMQGVPVQFPAQNPTMLPFPTPQLDPRAVRSDVTRSLDQLGAENTELRDRLERLEGLLEESARAREGVTAEAP